MGTEILHYRIDRKNLTLNNDKHCKVVEDENFNPKEIMQKNLQKVFKPSFFKVAHSMRVQKEWGF